ncbi:hypothetical protein [Pseudomonas sp. Irchel 3A5]|uniref:hypothetical protein n=1 Tax=Pseudomonas sp. Irchel 3A5 TaxID=2008911 RepID=UPI000BA2F899|nr:hypothetical protein [Pseudomonas sp. Irchel 3A5]
MLGFHEGFRELGGEVSDISSQVYSACSSFEKFFERILSVRGDLISIHKLDYAGCKGRGDFKVLRALERDFKGNLFSLVNVEFEVKSLLVSYGVRLDLLRSKASALDVTQLLQCDTMQCERMVAKLIDDIDYLCDRIFAFIVQKNCFSV